MKRFAFVSSMVGVAMLVALPVAAQQKAAPAAPACDKMISQIRASAGNRFDAASYAAKDKAMAAEKAHKDGKAADCEKAAKEGLTLLGVKM
jgi:hypothetical protein